MPQPISDVILENCNDAQRQAITYQAGHLLIVAGPGTGKTHTLTHRIAHLAPQLSGEERILAVTFTNKAAEQMRQRLQALLPGHDARVDVGTFHAFCLKLLRDHAGLTALPVDFRIATPSEIIAFAKEVWRDASAKQRAALLDEISRCKAQYPHQPLSDDALRYNALLRKNGLVDFDDILCEALDLVRAQETVRAALQRTYRFICVDEYQDINPAQHALLKELVTDHNTITAIGDSQQAIYGFRGCDVSFFESFCDDFLGAHVLPLSENYRSASNLLSASGQVIAKSAARHISALRATILSQGMLTIYAAPTDKAEAEYVVHQIEQMVGGTSMFSQDSGRVSTAHHAERTFGDIAVLYRLNSQKHILQEAFARSGIPYQVSGEKSLCEQPGITDILESMRAAPNATSSIVDMLHAIRDTVEKRGTAGDINEESFRKIMSVAQKHTRVQDFLDELQLQRSDDMRDARAEKVSLMTMHAAKGLEFPVVFIVGCEQGIIPLERAGFSTDEQEERRLFYVGMTRAREVLYLTRAQRRRLYGQTQHNQPSLLLSDIEEELKSYEAARQHTGRRKNNKTAQMKLFDNV